jgi:hypothetical protein
MLRQFEQVSLEFKVVRRYRNPLQDALGRIDKIRHATGGKSTGSGIASANPSRPGTRANSRNGFRDRDRESAPASGRTSRNEGRGGDDENGVDVGVVGLDGGRASFESDGGRGGGIRDEAEEICRRLWESAEVLEHQQDD